MKENSKAIENYLEELKSKFIESINTKRQDCQKSIGELINAQRAVRDEITELEGRKRAIEDELNRQAARQQAFNEEYEAAQSLFNTNCLPQDTDTEKITEETNSSPKEPEQLKEVSGEPSESSVAEIPETLPDQVEKVFDVTGT